MVAEPLESRLLLDGAGGPVAASLVAPFGLVAQSQGGHAIQLSWAALPGADAIEVERQDASGGGFRLLKRLSGDATVFEDVGLDAGKAYAYRLRAIDGEEFSLPGSPVAAATNKPGDANGDGRVNISDFHAIDAGRARQRAGWAHGDFDGDGGMPNADDYMVIDRAFMGPGLRAALTEDTGASGSDALTRRAEVSGRLARPEGSGPLRLHLGLDFAPAAQFLDVTGSVSPAGGFVLDRQRLEQAAGGPLAEGLHVVHLRVVGAAGEVVDAVDVPFTLDTQAQTPSLRLAASFGSDATTTARAVTLLGSGEPGAVVTRLPSGTVQRVGDLGGQFAFQNVVLALGTNTLSFGVTDLAGNSAPFSAAFTRLAPQAPNQVVLDWNKAMLDAVVLDASTPPWASRNMAIVSAAMYDAVNAVNKSSSFLYVSVPASHDASVQAAVAAAAHRALSVLYPAQLAVFDAKLSASLASVPDGRSKSDGVAAGRATADAVLAQREDDGARAFLAYTPGSGPGRWQPTAPMFAPALLPHWGDLKPFAMTTGSQFRPAGPPALTSARYAQDLAQVKGLGSALSTTRTAEQTQVARFWADGAGTHTPAGHWNDIAAKLLQGQNRSLFDSVRLLAQLNVAMADAAVVAWDAKYAFDFWRPLTAIRGADRDGNPATTPDANWTPLIVTPPFQDYVSGHSTFSGAAESVLAHFFGPNQAFTAGSPNPALAGVARSYGSFAAAAEEASMSRVYGGIHFASAGEDGLTAGRALGNYVVQKFGDTADTRPPEVTFTTSASPKKSDFTLTGRVVDDLSGVQTLQARIDGGPAFSIGYGAAGNFSVPVDLAENGSADGPHTVRISATDWSGNVAGDVRFTFTFDTRPPELTVSSPSAGATLAAGSRLVGVVNGSGSPLTSLTHSVDGGTAIPLSFDPATGTFNQPLNVAELAAGAHVLALRAIDAGGNVASMQVNVSLPARIPLTLAGHTPAAGTSDVGSTFRPQVHFSRPIDATTLTADNFFASVSGSRLPASIVQGADSTFAWLFLDSPMPGASTVTVTVNGATIKTADGSALDADGDGSPGGVLTYTFTTVPLAGTPDTTITDIPTGNQQTVSTSLYGTVADPGPDLMPNTADDVRPGPDGLLMTADDVYLLPIAGARVHILGREGLMATTDLDGKFTLASVPAGNVKLAVDGTAATNAPAGFFFPEMVMDLSTRAGVANTVMQAMQTRAVITSTEPGVHLPRLQTSILKPVSDTETTVIGVDAVSAPNLTAEQRRWLQIEVPPNSLLDVEGRVIKGGRIGISTVPAEMVRDMLPPGLVEHTFDVTIQAPGVAKFAQPLVMTLPNVFNAPPGTKVNFISFDHTTGRLVVEGTATVSADGQSVRTDPGSGVRQPGWHGDTDPRSRIRGQVFDACLRRIGDKPNTLAADRAFLTEVAIGTFKAAAGSLGVGFYQGLAALAGTTENYTRFVQDQTFLNWAILFGGAGADVGSYRTAFNRALAQQHGWFTGLGWAFDAADLAQSINDVWDVSRKVDEWHEQMRQCVEPTADALIKLEELKASVQALGEELLEANRQFDDMVRWQVEQFDLILDLLERPGGGPPLIWSDFEDRQVIENRLGNTDRTNPDQPSGQPGNPTIVLPPIEPQRVPPSVGDLITDRESRGIPVVVIPPPSARESDVGDTLSTAKRVAVALNNGLAIDQTLGDNSRGVNDVDVYAFDGRAGDVISIDLQRQSRELRYAVVRLFDGAGNELAFDLGSGLQDMPSVRYAELPGTGVYYVAISSYGNRDYDPHTAEGRQGGKYMGDYRLVIQRRDARPTLGAVLDEATINYFVADAAAQAGIFVGPGAGAYQRALEVEQRFDELFVPLMAQPVAGERYIAVRADGSGFTTRSRSNPDGRFEQFVAPEAGYTLFVYDPVVNEATRLPLISGGSGEVLALAPVWIGGSPQTDSDGDGLSDDAEVAVGTFADRPDSDGDGINDLAEVRQNLDPLGGLPTAIGVLSSLGLRGEAKDIVAEGSTLDGRRQTAYVATGTHGLAVVDASDFNRPVVLAELDLVGNATDVAVAPVLSLAVVAAGAGGLHVVDVSDPVRPVLRQTIDVAASHVEVVGGVAYVGEGRNLRAIDLLDGEELQVLDLGGRPISGLARENAVLYTMDEGRKLSVITLDGAAMNLRGDAVLSHGGGRLFVANGIAYAVAESYSQGGYVTANVSEPDAPDEISGSDVPGQIAAAGTALAANGSGLALVAGRTLGRVNALDILDSSDPQETARFVTRVELPSAPVSLAIAGGVAFVTTGTGGLQVVNYRAFDSNRVAPQAALDLLTVDLDPVAPGVQLQEGSLVDVRARVGDDVQVRNVELLLNGQVVRNDVSFPFDLSAVLPTRVAAEGPVRLQVRATDTGGNSTLTDPLTIELVPDTFAPELVTLTPGDGATRGPNTRSVTADFSEPMDPATLAASSFLLTGPSGSVAPTGVVVTRDGASVSLTFPTLAVGNYQLAVKRASLKDRAGNALGQSDLVTSFTVSPYSTRFINEAGGSWHDPGNWSTGVVPGPDDDVMIDLPASATVTFSAGETSVRSLVSSAALVLSGGTLSVSRPSKIEGAFTLSGGTLSGSGSLTVLSRFVWTDGDMTGSGSTTVAATAAASITGGSNRTISRRTLNLAGTTVWEDGDVFLDDATVNNAGTFEARSDNAFRHWDGSTVFVNAGTLIKSGAATSRFDVAFHNAGRVEARGGTLQFNGGGSSEGLFEALTQGSVTFTGGTHTLTPASRLFGAGLFGFAGGTTNVNGDFDVAGTTSISGGSLSFNTAAAMTTALNLSGGSLGGAGALSALTAFNWTDGNLGGGNGSLTVPAGSAATISGTANRWLSAYTLNLAGSATWIGGEVFLEDAVINNSGTFLANAPNVVRHWDGVNAFNNSGTLRKSAANTSRFDVPVNNLGTAEAPAGVLQFNGGGSSAGVFSALLGGQIGFTGGVHALAAGSSVMGAGTVYFAGGTTALNGTYSVTGTTNVNGGAAAFNGAAPSTATLQLSDGSLGGSGALAVTGNFSWTGGNFSQGSGSTTVLAGAAASISVTANRWITRYTLNLAGNTTWTGGEVFLEDAVVNNSGTFDAKAANAFRHWDGTNAFNNTGTLRATAAAATTTSRFDVPVNNSGTVAGQSSVLRLNGGGLSTGRFTTSPGGTVSFSGGDHTLAPPSMVDGTGTIAFTGGTTQVNGAYVVARATSVAGGIVAFNAAASATELTLSEGRVGGSGTLTIGNTLLWTGGNFAEGGGSTTLAAGATGTISGTANRWLSRYTLNLAGGSTWTGGEVFLDDAVVNNSGIFDAKAAYAFRHWDGTNAFNNSGVLRGTAAAGTTASRFDIPVNNSGTVSGQSSTLRLNGGGVSTGQFTTSAGGTLSFFGGNHTLSPTSTVGGAGTVAFSGGTTHVNGAYAAGGTTSVDGGIVSFNGAASTVDLAASEGRVGGSGTLTVGGMMTWTGGHFADGKGATTLAAGATATISGTANRWISRYTLNLAGNTTWTGGEVFLEEAVVNNSGTFDARAAYAFRHWDGTNAFNNFGALTRTTAGVGRFDIPVNNTGSVEPSAGTLQFNGGGSSPGRFAPALGAAVSFSGGSHTLSAASAVTGAGTIAFSGGTSQVNGTYNVSGTTAVSGGAVSFNSAASTATLSLSDGRVGGAGTLAVGSSLAWAGGDFAEGGGAATLAAGATATISGTSNRWIARYTLNLAGSTTWTGGEVFFYDGVLNNSGTFLANAATAFRHWEGTNAFNNSGILGKTASNTSRLDIPVINSGTLQADAGAFAFNSSLTNSGTLDLGSGVRTVSVIGPFTQTASGVMNVQLGGAAANQFDRLLVSGAATLAGKINVALVGGFEPAPGTTFQFMTFASRSGTVTVTDADPSDALGFSVNAAATSMSLVATAGAPLGAPPVDPVSQPLFSSEPILNPSTW